MMSTAGFVAAALAGVCLLYLLRPPPQHFRVPSLAPWRRVIVAGTTPRRQRRWWLSLALAGAIATLLALGVTQPEFAGLGGASRRVVLVIDNSPSMASRVNARFSRFDLAREHARRLIDGGNAASRFMLLDTMGDSGVPSFDNRATALHRLDALRPVASGQPRLPAVARLDQATHERYFISDGVADINAVGFTQVSVFVPRPNAAISAFAVRTLAADPRRAHALVGLRNTSTEARSLHLTISDVTGRQVQRSVQLTAGAEQRFSLALDGLSAGPLRANVVMPDDALALDDTAYAVLSARSRLRILLVGSPEPLLARALRLDPRVHLKQVSATAYRGAVGFDAVVFDGTAPEARPEVPALLWRPAERPWLGVHTETLGANVVTAWNSGHPVLRGVTLHDVDSQRSLVWPAPTRGDILVRGEGGEPLVIADAASPRQLLVAFRPAESNLPRRPAFPVLVRNALAWLTDEAPAIGQSLGAISLSDATTSVLDAGRAELPLQQRPGARHLTVTKPSVLRVEEAKAGYWLAVNFFDPRASAINQSAFAGRPPSAPPRLERGWEPWWLCAALALLLISVEWWSYHRRSTE